MSPVPSACCSSLSSVISDSSIGGISTGGAPLSPIASTRHSLSFLVAPAGSVSTGDTGGTFADSTPLFPVASACCLPSSFFASAGSASTDDAGCTSAGDAPSYPIVGISLLSAISGSCSSSSMLSTGFWALFLLSTPSCIRRFSLLSLPLFHSFLPSLPIPLPHNPTLVIGKILFNQVFITQRLIA